MGVRRWPYVDGEDGGIAILDRPNVVLHRAEAQREDDTQEGLPDEGDVLFHWPHRLQRPSL